MAATGTFVLPSTPKDVMLPLSTVVKRIGGGDGHQSPLDSQLQRRLTCRSRLTKRHGLCFSPPEVVLADCMPFSTLY